MNALPMDDPELSRSRVGALERSLLRARVGMFAWMGLCMFTNAARVPFGAGSTWNMIYQALAALVGFALLGFSAWIMLRQPAWAHDPDPMTSRFAR